MSMEEGEEEEEEEAEEEEHGEFTERQHRARYDDDFQESEADRYYPASVAA